MRLELTRKGLLVKLNNHYNTPGAYASVFLVVIYLVFFFT